MKVKAFITHKECERYSDCQDRFSINVGNGTIAVSDGVSQSFFPDFWAEILTEHYTNTGHLKEDDLSNLCEEWHNRVKHFIDSKGDSIHWRTKNNFEIGESAGATFCGIKFFNEANMMSCTIIGDTYIIIAKNGNVAVYPENPEFGNTPDFLDSSIYKNGRGNIREINIEYFDDETILIVTDALGQYLLSDNRSNVFGFIERLSNIENHKDYCQYVNELRIDGMHNDDCTVCMIKNDEDRELEIKYKDDIEKLIEDEPSSDLGKNDGSKFSLPSKSPKEDSNLIKSAVKSKGKTKTRNIVDGKKKLNS